MISVCIPTYEQNGSGAKYLTLLLQSLKRQQGVTFDVIVSDNSAGDALQTVCASFANRLAIRYLRNPVLGVSNNSNNAIAHATHDFIKIMYQDDLLIDSFALAKFADALTRKAWVVSSFRSMDANGCFRTLRNPVWPRNILAEKNTFGMPSIIAVRKDPEIVFDPNLRVLLDCEYYWLFQRKYGSPEHIRMPLVGCRYWDGSVSRIQGNHNFLAAERAYLVDKHMNKSSLTENDERMTTSIARHDICTDIAGNIVPCGDRRAAFVLVGRGREIPAHVQKKIEEFAARSSPAADMPHDTYDDNPEPDNPGPEHESSGLSVTKIKKRRKRIIAPTGIH